MEMKKVENGQSLRGLGRFEACGGSGRLGDGLGGFRRVWEGWGGFGKVPE